MHKRAVNVLVVRKSEVSLEQFRQLGIPVRIPLVRCDQKKTMTTQTCAGSDSATETAETTLEWSPSEKFQKTTPEIPRANKDDSNLVENTSDLSVIEPPMPYSAKADKGYLRLVPIHKLLKAPSREQPNAVEEHVEPVLQAMSDLVQGNLDQNPTTSEQMVEVIDIAEPSSSNSVEIEGQQNDKEDRKNSPFVCQVPPYGSVSGAKGDEAAESRRRKDRPNPDRSRRALAAAATRRRNKEEAKERERTFIRALIMNLEEQRCMREIAFKQQIIDALQSCGFPPAMLPRLLSANPMAPPLLPPPIAPVTTTGAHEQPRLMSALETVLEPREHPEAERMRSSPLDLSKQYVVGQNSLLRIPEPRDQEKEERHQLMLRQMQSAHKD